MAQYSPEFLTSLKHRYEKTDQPMIELAREFGIGITTLQVLVDKQGWEKRSQRLRGLPRAARLEREAEVLAGGTVPLSGRGSEAAPLVARAGGGEPTVEASGPEPSPVARLEALVVQEIADLESARDLRGGKRVSGAGAERTAQALASLTNTLQTIRRMRGEQPASDFADDAVDIDEQREQLAYRIESLVSEWLAEDERTAAAEAAAD